ncbi:MAG: hypothetical protein D6803_06175 [Anaerolineae bacterium]|nr:MAG: hypothetical protein D6803_06175 [Anaerolineae bacterium]
MTAGRSRGLLRNLGTLLLAFVLAVVVWVSAVTSADPNQEQTFVVPVEIIGEKEDLEILTPLPDTLEVTLLAPRSILEQIQEDAGALSAWMDFSHTGAGRYVVAVQYHIAEQYRPVRVVKVNPQNVEVTLEALVSRMLPIETRVTGEPALGYQAAPPEWSLQQVTVSGRVSQVEKVDKVVAELNIEGANETIERSVRLVPLDANGNRVDEVTLEPDEVNVVQTITLRGGYRNMVVKVVTTGQVAEGYRQTSISVSPPNVMVFSADPQIVNQLPGYVETQPLDLSGAVDDIETILSLNLPEGVSVIGDPNVLVQVGIAAMEGNAKVIRVVEVIGLLPEMEAQVAPDAVDVILFGPLPVLDSLADTDVRVLVDLSELEPGVHQLSPQVIVLPEGIRVEAIVPESIEVNIQPVSTPTPTATP